jgi:hypothetical protein
VDQLGVDTWLSKLNLFLFKEIFFSKKKKKDLGVVSATHLLAPCGGYSHPLVPEGVVVATPSFFFFFLSLFSF